MLTWSGPQRAVVQPGTFAHPLDAVAAGPGPLTRPGGGRSGAVVGHLEIDPRIVVAENDEHLRGAGVLQGVREGFLHDSVHA